jgi:thiol-disulfide isomerase/thioredoxin|tara:strand:- start:2076 stop:2549 length:474 start_codon:yes stop_codon:yes gene_type:complete
MLDSIKENLSNIFSNKKSLMIIGLTLLFIIIAIYTYKTWIVPRLSSNDYVENQELVIEDENNQGGVVELYFFYTEWCPHCKTAKPIWNKFKQEIGENKIKGKTINFIEVDAEKESGLANQFKVEGYPTIKLVDNNKIIEYDAKPELDTLHQFLNTSL